MIKLVLCFYGFPYSCIYGLIHDYYLRVLERRRRQVYDRRLPRRRLRPSGEAVHIVDLDNNRTVSRWFRDSAIRPRSITVSTPDPQELTAHLQELAKTPRRTSS